MCPLCGCSEVLCKEIVDVASLNNLYRKLLDVEEAVKSASLLYQECLQCGLGFFDPMETGSEQFYEHLQRYDWYYMADKQEFRLAQKYLPHKGSVLEVGAGRAFFAEYVGLDRYRGLEFNSEAICRARANGVELLKESIESHVAAGNKYDCVVSFQVLEHVNSPASFIQGCVDCLNPGGIMILSVPSRDGFAGGTTNHILDLPPHHVTRWSERTLYYVADKFDLSVLGINAEKVADYHLGWAQKLLWEERLRKLLKVEPRLVSNSRGVALLSRFASILAGIAPMSLEKVKGHTVLACYQKA